MKLIDAQGHRVSGATAESLQAWEQAAHALRCMVDDPLADTERALALAPEMTMAHVLKAWRRFWKVGAAPEATQPAPPPADVNK